VRKFDPLEVSLQSKLSLNGTLFIRKKGSTETLQIPPSLGESESKFLELETGELAKTITLQDHHLFCQINPLEFIYHIYNMKSKDTSNLNKFVNVFNRTNLWVVTEICSEPNLNKRVMIIRKFIKLAIVCSFFFALLSSPSTHCYFFFPLTLAL